MSAPRGVKRSLSALSSSPKRTLRSLSPLTDLEDDLPSGNIQDPKAKDSPKKSKKLKLVSTYATTSPFPDYLHPTYAEAHAIHALLYKTHSLVRRTSSANAAATCGGVPNVLDALVGTILSQNTSAANSTRAKRDLDAAFGLHNFAAIANAPQARVYDAIRHGGLARKKSTTIQTLLNAIYARHGVYSLQHLAAPDVTDTQAMLELQEYDGVGPKTAACVLMFSLARDIFAVDTHVYRLSRLLGWVPVKADRVAAQAHLDVRIPPELKHDLHVLMVQHGRRCKGCKGIGTKGDCVLKTWLRERKVVDKMEAEKVREKYEKYEGEV